LIDRELAALAAPRGLDTGAAARAAERLVAREQVRVAKRAARRSNEPNSIWSTLGAFTLSGPAETGFAITVDGEPAAALVRFGDGEPQVRINGERAVDCLVVDVPGAAIAWRNGRQTVVALADATAVDLEHLDASGVVTAPMHGKVLSLEVAVGDAVRKGERLLVLEAMKMEHALTAPMDGRVAELVVAAGDQVAEDAKLLVIEPGQHETA
jgi:3-methylcrotonyl-CoA carboxylase alpha subunit